MQPMIIDISHLDPDHDMGNLKHRGNIVGVIMKATQGSGMVDLAFPSRYERACSVWGAAMVGAYHFQDNSAPEAQIEHFIKHTPGVKGRWLDYEPNTIRGGTTCSLDTALKSCQILQGKTGRWPGEYGSDGDLLGSAIDAGHFGPCAKWLARYDAAPPKHKWDLWQYSAGESNTVLVDGQAFDVSVYNGTVQECIDFLTRFGS